MVAVPPGHNVIDGSDPLGRSGMCQHQLAVAVSNGIYAGDIRLEMVVGHNLSAIEDDSGFFQSDTLGHGSASYTHQYLFPFYRLGLSLVIHMDRIRGAGLFDGFYPGVGQDGDSPGFEIGPDHAGNFCINRRQDPRQCFHNGTFRSQRSKERGKFNSDHPTADNDEALGYFG